MPDDLNQFYRVRRTSMSMRLLVAPLAFFLVPPLGAADKPAEARRAALVRAGYTPVHLTFDSRHLGFDVNGSIGPEKVKFVLNSGSPETVLDMSLANRLKLKDLGRRTYVSGLVIGPYDTRKDWPNVAIQAHDLSGWPGTPGCVLGMEVLDSWAAVVDYPSRTLYLRPPLATAWPRLAGAWVVTNWQVEGAARKIDPQAPPTFTFADRRLKVTDGGKTREYAIRFGPNDSGDYLLLIDPKRDRDLSSIEGGGRVKVKDGVMTLCLLLETDKPRDLPTAFAAPKGSGYVLLDLKRTDTDAPKPPADPIRDLLLKGGYTAVPLAREADGTRVATARARSYDLRLVVDVGTTVSRFGAMGLSKWGAERLGKVDVEGLGEVESAEKIRLRGLMLGRYNTRRAWAVVNGCEYDLAEVNQLFAEQKRKPIQGSLGSLDLLNGSAVIDFGTNTMYLRPIKETVVPQLAGKWVGVRYESEGQKGQYKAGDGAVEFKNGQLRFVTPGGTEEWGFHLRDIGDRYRVGLFDPKADELADGFKYASGGLLKLTGDKITLVMEQGPVRKEPTEFAAPAGSGLLLVEYERAK
jgi:hypothetical protein